MGEDFKSIPEATCGIAFFATPHQGSDIGKLGEIAAIISKEVNQNSSDSLLESMKKDSLYSDDLANQFRHQLFNYYFLSFYERLRSKETGCLVRVSHVLMAALCTDVNRSWIRNLPSWASLATRKSKYQWKQIIPLFASSQVLIHLIIKLFEED